jgi:hypothetical protein
MRSPFSLLALGVAAALPSLASAVDFSYSGFATAAYAQSDTDNVQVGYSAQPESIDKGGSFETDSKVGLQVTAKFNDLVSATVQGVSYADLTGDWEPRLDWAYVRVQPMQHLSLRGGYLRAPTFMYSDSVFVGYANTWVRPPLEVYNLAAVYQMRGVDATWRTTVGPVQLSINPYYGDGEVDIPNDTLDVSEWIGLATTAEYGSWLARIGYSEVELGSTSKSVAPLIASLRSIPASVCAACAAEANHLDLNNTLIHTLDVGVQFDDGKNFVATEYAQSSSGENYLVTSKTGAYVTYGRRFGNIMPYATYALLRRDQPTQSDRIPTVGALAALNAAVNGVIDAGNGEQESYTVGVRYEVPSFSVLKGSIVKLQFDHIDATSGRGMLNNPRAGFDGNVNLVSASFDFIF